MKDSYPIRKCTACGLTQLYPLPSPEVLSGLYGDGYFDGAGVGYEGYAAQAREYLETFAEDVRRVAEFVPEGSVLDVGCGFGWFVRQALSAGYDAYGVDTSEEAIRIARRELEGRVFHGSIDSVPELRERRFAAVFASHVIEHIPKPDAFVADLASRLTPEGVLVFVTPNIESWLARLSGARWVSFKVPEHVAYYSPKTISRLLEGAGLEPLAFDSACQYYALPFLMQRVRELVHPLDRIVPKFENHARLSGRMLRVTSGSLRVIAGRRAAGDESLPPASESRG